ncbi:MAG: cobalamin-dependent protein, partial [Actinomycetota bacterium]
DDRGGQEIARALRDAGFEVIFAGSHQAPEQVAETVLQEDADAVGLGMTPDDPALLRRVVDRLRERELGHVVVFGRGAGPAGSIPAGPVPVFTPGTPWPDVTGWLEHALDDREAQLTG